MIRELLYLSSGMVISATTSPATSDARAVGEIFIRRQGRGPELLLVHGGASPRATWQELATLRERWTLVIAHRRGFEPSPPGRQDFDADAVDLAPLLAGRPHVVAHSYGGLGALIAAGGHPERVKSLTLIEPPLFHLTPGDPEVEELERLGNEFLKRGLEAEPACGVFCATPAQRISPRASCRARRERRAACGVPTAAGCRGDARPDLGALRDAGVPALVAAGGHSARERICAALAGELVTRGETAYRRLIADWKASGPAKKGAGATQGRPSSGPSTGQAGRQTKAPKPAL